MKLSDTKNITVVFQRILHAVAAFVVAGVAVFTVSAAAAAATGISHTEKPPKTQYLLFQLFTFSPDPAGKTMPFNKKEISGVVDEIINRLGGLRGDGKTRQLGFSIGPLALDHTDEELRTAIRESFEIAGNKNVAVAFHIDDSMFWVRRSDLWQNPDNVEWTDWNKTSSPHRTIGWVGNSAGILAPQMCFNSPAVKKEIRRIAKEVIGPEIKKGIAALKANNRERLFAGVIAGWETRLDDDSQPKVQAGYCALHNIGFSRTNPPKDFDNELAKVVRDFAGFWT